MTSRRAVTQFHVDWHGDDQRVEMPAGSQVLSATIAAGSRLVVVASCPVGERIVGRYFCVRPTGGQYTTDREGRYLATVSTHGGEVQWHIYETTFCVLSSVEGATI